MSVLDQIEVLPAGGPAWLETLRTGAVDRLRRTGLPGKKTESWRFTPVAPLDQMSFGAPGRSDLARVRAAAEAMLSSDDGCFRIWIVNGEPLAIDAPPHGVRVQQIAQCAGDADVRAHLGAHARAEYFGALNAALFEHGVVIRIERGARPSQPIHVIHVADADGGAVAVYPRLLVLAGADAQAVLVESHVALGKGKLLVSPVTEIALADGARLEHVRASESTAEASYHTATLAAHLGRGAVYQSRVVTLGGALARLDIEVVLDGEGAECELFGAYHATGKEHVDHYTRIDHARPRCTSRENYRGIIDGRGHAVFDGTVIVRRDAQHTNAQQENRNLLLSDGAGVNTKPHLEIDADDVVCSHGATVGALDEDQLFYLRARGIAADQAEVMLTLAFLRSVVESIGHPPVRERLERALLARLPYGATLTGASGILAS